jgi:DNA-binding NarL/FixJ family response regulator
MQCALVVDDLPAVRAGFVELLRENYPEAQIFEAGRMAEAMHILQREPVDLLLVDLGLPDASGLELIRALVELRPQARSVVVTIFDDDDHLFPALQAGAFGYLLKDRPKIELRAQLRRIQDGEPPLSPSIARRMVQHFTRLHAGPAPLLNRDQEEQIALTERESEVLQLVGKGYTLPEIAVQLGLSRHTVADYVKQIYRKLNISSRAEAALEAVRRGLVR